MGKRRDGGTRYWCLRHKADSTAKYGKPAIACRASHITPIGAKDRLELNIVNGTERCPVFGKIRCPIFCTLKDSNPGCYPEAALPSSSFTATLSIPALRLVLSR